MSPDYILFPWACPPLSHCMWLCEYDRPVPTRSTTGKIDAFRRRWHFELHRLQRIDDDEIPISLAIRRDGVPGSVLGTGRRDDVLKCLHIIIPVFVLFEVAEIPLPALFRIGHAGFQPFLLLVFRDMEKELQGGCPIFVQEFLKFLDLVERCYATFSDTQPCTHVMSTSS